MDTQIICVWLEEQSRVKLETLHLDFSSSSHGEKKWKSPGGLLGKGRTQAGP